MLSIFLSLVELVCFCSCATERSMQGVAVVGSGPRRYDVTWESPSKGAAGSMPLGNGDIGLNAWVEENGDLAFYISKTDSWGDNGRLLKVGARKGIGLKLARAVIRWARDNGWKRIVKVAHCELDWFYGIQGGGGKTFWEKVGFNVVGSFQKDAWEFNKEHGAIVQAQMAEKGMREEGVWTWYRMMYEL